MTQKNTTKQIPIIAQRRSGVLMHLSSLHGPFACGDLGPSAYQFIDFLSKSKQTWWQTLPINPIGLGYSPYSSVSSFAGEILFISQEGLLESGLLKSSEMLKGTNAKSNTNYAVALDQKMKMLKKAFERKKSSPKYKYKNDLKKFSFSERSWLSDYALFKVLSHKHGTNWAKWPKPLRDRNPDSIGKIQTEHSDDIEFIEFCQFEFFRQWYKFRDYAHKNGVKLMGDIPIFVSHESADVWANQKLFFLRKDGNPSFVAGCPPDKFCPDGQLWGNALYDWKAMEKEKFSWWIARFKKLFSMYDSVRLDHFIGFYNYWKIPSSAKTAKTGKWEKARGDALFSTVKKTFGNAPLLAEDLGKVSQGVWDLRDKYQFPGMKVLQFGFAKGGDLDVHKVHQIPENSITYSGTHDNDTAVGWYHHVMNEKPSKHEKDAIKLMFPSPAKVGTDLIQLGMLSRTNIFIFPIQDLLNLDGKFRMNIPGTANGNWQFRLTKKLFEKAVDQQKYLSELSSSSQRNT